MQDARTGEVGRKPDAADPWSSTWVRHYDRASRQRHKRGGYKRLRAEARRKRRVEIAALAAAGLGVTVIFLICCAILSR